MIKKIFSKIKNFFVPTKQGVEDICEHSNRVSKTVKYCIDCKLVLDEN